MCSSDLKISTNASNKQKSELSFYVSYPVSQTVIKFLKYGAIGAGIGVGLRGILTLAGFENWLFNYYEFISWKDIWNKGNVNGNEIWIPVVFFGFAASIFFTYKILRK